MLWRLSCDSVYLLLFFIPSTNVSQEPNTICLGSIRLCFVQWPPAPLFLQPSSWTVTLLGPTSMVPWISASGSPFMDHFVLASESQSLDPPASSPSAWLKMKLHHDTLPPRWQLLGVLRHPPTHLPSSNFQARKLGSGVCLLSPATSRLDSYWSSS